MELLVKCGDCDSALGSDRVSGIYTSVQDREINGKDSLKVLTLINQDSVLEVSDVRNKKRGALETVGFGLADRIM
jgi:hypothetical protein